MISDDTVLLLGPSSAGKSTFLDNQIRMGRVTRDRVHFAYEFRNGKDVSLHGKQIIHYNMFDPFSNGAGLTVANIRETAPIRNLFSISRPRSALICVVPKRVLLKRIMLREALEPSLQGTYDTYPSKEIFELANKNDLVDIYKTWIDFLDTEGIPFEFLITQDQQYDTTHDRVTALSLLDSNEAVAYSSEERARALSNFTFPYHRVDGFAVTASNPSRHDTLDTIRPYLHDGSVLDIGCGIGSFCFALEKEGYGPIVGAELKSDRFLAACALREVSGSQCLFTDFDFLREKSPPTEAFDNVLLLNVIHHLQNPLGSLQIAAALTKRTLILEYPTLSDPKFLATASNAVFDPSLPLIGVSLLDEQDQTFLFSDSALQRILTKNQNLFTSIEFLRSPMSSSRRIAVCRK